MTDCTYIRQPRKRRRDITPALTIIIQSLTASADDSQVADITPVTSINHSLMLLQQFLPAIRQISSEFFIS